MSRKCENCGGNEAKAQATILKLPHILVLQLKRLHMDRDVPCTKIPAPVKFTPHLDIGTCHFTCLSTLLLLTSGLVFLLVLVLTYFGEFGLIHCWHL